MLSNAYFLAKFRFDTAENEHDKNLQNFRKMRFRKMRFRKCIFEKAALAEGQPRVLEALAEVRGHEVRRLAPRAELEVHQRAHLGRLRG